MDRLEWLREKSAASWPDADATADGPDRGSALFLLRPPGWPAELMKLAADLADDGEERARAAGNRDRDLEVARTKLKAAGRELAEQRKRIAELERMQRAPERERAASEARQAEAVRAADERHAREVDALRHRLEESEAALGTARQEAREAKRDRSELVGRLEELRRAGSWADRDPIELAVHLDAVAAQARGQAESGSVVGELPLPALPAGITPDSAAAVEAVVRMEGPIGLLVDGYNAGLAFGSGPPAEVRSRVLDVLRRVRTLGGAGMVVTVVFDSDSDLAERRVPDGLDVRFAAPGVPADDVLVSLAARTPRAVVITNDREVRERAEAAGALTLWSTALVAWARRR